MKSGGNRSWLRLTAWLKAFVVTPYNAARFTSRMTLCPRIKRIEFSILSAGTTDDRLRAIIYKNPITMLKIQSGGVVLRIPDRQEMERIIELPAVYEPFLSKASHRSYLFGPFQFKRGRNAQRAKQERQRAVSSKRQMWDH